MVSEYDFISFESFTNILYKCTNIGKETAILNNVFRSDKLNRKIKLSLSWDGVYQNYFLFVCFYVCIFPASKYEQCHSFMIFLLRITILSQLSYICFPVGVIAYLFKISLKKIIKVVSSGDPYLSTFLLTLSQNAYFSDH